MKNENLEVLENTQRELIEELRAIPNTGSTEYMSTMKDLEAVNRQIQTEHDYELKKNDQELRSHELAIKEEEMKNHSYQHSEEIKQRKSDNKVKLIISGIGAGVTTAGYLIVTHAEETQAVVSKVFNLIPKRKVD